jgi:hypothetical protein
LLGFLLVLGYVHDVFLPPQNLSDVAATNADHESHEWHPKTKFNADNLKGKGNTNLASKGHKLYHKALITNILTENDKTKLIAEGHDQYTKLIADILMDIGKTKLIAEGHKQYHKTKVDGGFMPAFMEDKENPYPGCDPVFEDTAACLVNEGEGENYIEVCAACLFEAWYGIAAGTYCSDLQEVGFCADVGNCLVDSCNQICTTEWLYVMDCVIFYDGCTESQFESECFSGI